MKKTLSTILALAIIAVAFAGTIIPVSADIADGTILLNEKMLYEQQQQGENLFSKTQANGSALSAGTAANSEWSNGKLILTADSSTNTWFTLPDTSVDLETFTWRVTFKVTTNGSNPRFQTGVRTSGYMNSWDNGTLIRIARSGGKAAHQALNKCANAGSKKNTSPVTSTYSYDNTEMTVKIIVSAENVTFLFEDITVWTIPASEYSSGGVISFGLGTGSTVEIGSFTLYAGAGSEPTNVPAGLGYQLSSTYEKNTKTVADIRFIACGSDLSVRNVGFRIVAEADGMDQKIWDEHTTTVYTSLLADGDTVTAASYGADYLYGLAIRGIPTDTEITFTVTPYYTDDGSTVHYGTSFCVVVNVPST